MSKNKTNNSELTLSEMKQIIEETIKSIKEGDFERESEKIKKDWGGEIEPEEDFDAEEFFGDAGDAAEADIRAEFGDDEFASFGSLEDPNMLRDLEEDAGQKGMFKPQDSEGNDINLKALVTSLDGSKKGRVVGFGDDGEGSLIVRVDWQWPTDMKFMSPEQMGEKREKPEEIIVQNINEEEMENINETKVPETLERLENLKSVVGAEELADLIIFKMEDSLANAIIDDIEQDYDITSYDDEQLNETKEIVLAKPAVYNAIMDFHNIGGTKYQVLAIVDDVFGKSLEETGRGLGKGIKRSGDRGVKMRDDKHSAPLTNLNESVNNKIKSLVDGSITKKELQKFIMEEANKVAKTLKG